MTVLSTDIEPTELGQIPDLSPTLAVDAIAGIPATGTGLTGDAYANGSKIWSLERLDEIIDNTQPQAGFSMSEVNFYSRQSDTTLAEFLGENGAVTSGDGDIEMGPSGLDISGYIYIPPGAHTITIWSDDGYRLSLGGVEVSAFEGMRPNEPTAISAQFDGGLYLLDMQYFDGGGGMALRMEIDGLPVDQSAFYAAMSDFTDPPADVPLLDVDAYHPSHTLGLLTLDDAEEINGTDGIDKIDALGGDDTVNAGDGDDMVLGGYGDDSINGGDGDDYLDGGYGSDIIIGGLGDDLIVSRSDGGEQKIAQRYVVPETRPADGYVNPEFDKLYGYEDQPLIGDDIIIGGAGRDTVLIAPQINAIQPIIEKHTNSDGTIKWNKVAGENDFQHAHWVDLTGFDYFVDYNKEEDHIAVIGHTANVEVDYVDFDNDGDLESIVTVVSLQHGNGGAHDRDLLGVLFVDGDLVDVDDIQTDNGVTYGVVENYADVAEALHQVGETKMLEEGGVTHHGYDYRGEGEVFTPPEGDPLDLMDNPYLDQVAAHATSPTEADDVELTRDPFDQLGFVDGEGQMKTGTDGDDVITPDLPPEPDGLPGALGFWSLGASDTGAYADDRGELSAVKAYTLYENQAILRTADTTDGPRAGTSALTFNGEDQYAYLAHDDAFEITQGTIALWVRADDLSDDGAIVTKDQRNTGEGGHFRLIQEEDGGLLLRMAPGDGGSNRSWSTTEAILEEGVWAHLAVNFTADGVTVYKDGVALSDDIWTPEEGDVPSPGVYTEAYMLMNAEPWVFGADQRRTDINDTALVFATDDEDLDNPFDGALAEFGVWGGYAPEDVLTPDEITELVENGPGAALTNPSGPQPMYASDDMFDGGAGNDEIDGGAGNDMLNGGAGDDTITGGYGDDKIDGGDGDDVLNGGRGSDFVMGGAGNDLMIAGGDVGEDRAGQLVLYELGVDQPIRPFPDPSIDDALLKLVDWTDQPIYADDIFIGGEGEDHLAVETYINGKKDAIIDNVMTDGRTVHWHGVAGENDRVHDHWVDGFGIDIFGDFNADEDSISVIGHTTNIEISYDTVDTDGDGVDDSVLSLIRAYSQQGNNGGAHDEDELGILAVIGDMVTEDMVETDAGAHYGIVTTIDELQEALAPSDDPSTVTRPDDVFGYDDRDVEGRPLTSDPLAYSVNPYMDEAKSQFAWKTAQDLGPVELVNSHEGGSFDGETYVELAHEAGEAQTEGTILISFTADTPGEDHQALYSKDHSNFEEGGHVSIWVDSGGHLKVRYQTTEESYYLRSDDKIEAGQTYDMAFTFSEEGASLYVDGVLNDLSDEGEGFTGGMSGNTYPTVIGASAMHRRDDDPKARWFFDGEIDQVSVIDVEIGPVEALLLAEYGNDPSFLIDDDAGTEIDDPLPGDDDTDAGTGGSQDEGDSDTTDTGDTGDGSDGPDDNDGADSGDAAEAETIRLELGVETVLQRNSDAWHTVSFENEIDDAVVIMGPVSFNGGQGAMARVRNVTSTGFEYQIEEWEFRDGWHKEESVSWMAVSAGTHELASGQTLAAGRTLSDADLGSVISVSLDGFDETPSIFTQVASNSDDVAVVTRVSSVGPDQFEFVLQEEEASVDGTHGAEQIDWIALDGALEDVLNLTEIDGGLNHRFTDVSFDALDGTPVLLANMQSMLGNDTANLRYRSLEADGAELRVHEERSLDRERSHVFEDVALITGSEGIYDLTLA